MCVLCYGNPRVLLVLSQKGSSHPSWHEQTAGNLGPGFPINVDNSPQWAPQPILLASDSDSIIKSGLEPKISLLFHASM